MGPADAGSCDLAGVGCFGRPWEQSSGRRVGVLTFWLCSVRISSCLKPPWWQIAEAEADAPYSLIHIQWEDSESFLLEILRKILTLSHYLWLILDPFFNQSAWWERRYSNKKLNPGYSICRGQGWAPSKLKLEMVRWPWPRKLKWFLFFHSSALTELRPCSWCLSRCWRYHGEQSTQNPFNCSKIPKVSRPLNYFWHYLGWPTHFLETGDEARVTLLHTTGEANVHHGWQFFSIVSFI